PAALERLLDATNGISRTFAKLLRDNQGELDVTLRSVGAFINDIHLEAERIPELIDMLGTFFGRLSDVIRFDGPAGTKMAALRGFISLDLCLVYGVCLPGASADAASVSATGAADATPVDGISRADVLDARALRAM